MTNDKNSADIKDIPFINPCLNSREDCWDGQEMSVWGLNLVTVGTPGHTDGFNWDILTVAMKFGKYIHGAQRIDLKVRWSPDSSFSHHVAKFLLIEMK